MKTLVSLSGRERALLATLALLTLVAIFGPALPAHLAAVPQFADARGWKGMANAMDVLSNLPFAVAGLWGLYRLYRIDMAHAEAQDTLPALPTAQPANTLDCAWLFFAGLILTAGGSAFFHLQPDDFRLAADRAGMVVAFAGLIGLAVCERVSQRAGWVVAWLVLGAGLLAVVVSHEEANVRPWAVLQFGGMALVLALAVARPVAQAIGLKLGWVIAFYALAKLFELGDQAIYQATHQFVSGHSLKHMTAALAAWPVLAALRSLEGQALRHNPRTARA